ncbi:conserved exported protein of unknown function [Latilactobacillus sakei]|uniref:hypothetical protein n=1 Tax=Latilactobacillus sakei TaxID=1599 RepID=UPI000C6F14B0|nr:hypothetical protein [Latilactobacillus sakei]SON67486.1 conserved exported protein of unknown function [Latilactobacillus sakei]
MKMRPLLLPITLAIVLLMLTACQQTPAKTTSSRHNSQSESISRQNQQTYTKKTVQTYWLYYRHKTFFVIAHQPNEQLNTKDKLKTFLSQTTTQTLAHDSYQKLDEDGFIFIADNQFKPHQDFGYGIVTLGIPRDFTLQAIITTANLNDPSYNRYKIYQIR